MTAMTPGDYTRGRVRTDAETLIQMFPEIRARAFAVQGLDDFAALKRVQDAVAKLPEGGDWKTLQREIAAELGGGGGGTMKRAETILRTNGFQAYAAARYQKQMGNKEVFPYWKYVAMDDGRVRDSHAELDGVILPADDPFWRDHYPPWDFNCRCIVIELTEADARDEAEAGDGSMWGAEQRQMWLANHAGPDAARQFHFRPDGLGMDLRDLAKAEGRAPEDMEAFGRLMETRTVGTGEVAADGGERTETVRDWLWRPIRAEYQAKAAADGRERSWALDAWTGAELGSAAGTRSSVRVPELPAEAAGREIVVIHSHTGRSAAVSPRDALAATAPRIEAVEAVTVGGEWQRVKAVARSARMREMLREWIVKLDAARKTGDAEWMRRLKAEWQRWLESQERLGYLELKGEARI